MNALGVLLVSNDLLHWERRGIIVPQITYKEFNRFAGSKYPLNEKYVRYNEHERIVDKKGMEVLLWDKNVMFFPRRINGKLSFLHRIKPDIQIVCVNELLELTSEFWQDYFLHFSDNIVLASKYEHEVSYVGGGCPPIETEHGWLIIYHGVCDTVQGYLYSACAALLDLKNPQKEIARLPYPLFKSENELGIIGEMKNMCFPTGTVLVNDKLYIYYGTDNEKIAVASLSLSALLAELLIHKKIENPT